MGVATLAGIPAGFLAAGVGSWLVMRASGFMFARDNPNSLAFTEAGERVGEISAGGTIFLLVFGTLLGIMGAYFVAMIKLWLPGGAFVRGPPFGLVSLALLSPFALDRGNDDFQRFGDVRVNVTLFVSLFLVYGLLISISDAWLDPALPEKLELSWPVVKLKQAIQSIVLIAGTALGLLMMQIPVMFVLVAIVGADSHAERLQLGLIFVAALALLTIYLPGIPGEPAGDTHSPVRSRSKITYGSLGLILMLSAAATGHAVIALVSA